MALHIANESAIIIMRHPVEDIYHRFLKMLEEIIAGRNHKKEQFVLFLIEFISPKMKAFTVNAIVDISNDDRFRIH